MLTSQLLVAQTIDLSIQGTSISPSSVAAGNNLTASGSVNNAGTVPATSANIGFYLSGDNVLDSGDNLVGVSTGGSLNGGASSYRNVSLSIPGSTASGSYYILYVADHLNGITESNEQNNVSSVSITVVSPTVDFRISTANLHNSSSLAPGGSFSAEAIIINQGNSTASSSNMGYYLSVDATLDGDDAFIGATPGGSLSAGNYSYVYPVLTMPANTAPGTYYIIFTADYLHGVSESDETNNTVARQISVAAPFVDLIMQYPYLYSSSGAAGSTISTETRIHNQGNSTASSSNSGYYLSANNTLEDDDVFIGSLSGSALSAGNYHYRSGSLTIPSGTSPGAYFIIFVADYLNAVAESNENNNVNSIAFNVVTPAIDLTLNSLNVIPASVPAGNPVTIDVTVYNQGNTPAASSSLGYYLSANTTLDASDALLGFLNGAAISSYNSVSRSTTLTIPATTTPGNYYLIVAADYLNSISETNEGNNSAHAALGITAQGTAFITPHAGEASFTACTGKVYDTGGTANYFNNANGTITLHPAITGNKMRLTFNSFSVESCCDRLYIYDGTSTSAALIGTYTNNPGTVYATNPSGALTLRFTSDGSAVGTGFEADIACVATVPLPDLSILSPMASPASLPAGTVITVAATIANNSTVNASSGNLGYYLSANDTFEATDVYLGNSTSGILNGGSSSYRNPGLTIPANTTPGAYYILIKADYQGTISEENETNNMASVAINVTAPTIDLLLLSAFTSASTLASGNAFTVTSFIANQGATPALSSHVSYYLSANTTIEATDILLGTSFGATLTGGHSAERNRTLTLPEATTAGNYYLLFAADFAGQVSETNETNNTRSVAITVTSPDYVDLALQLPTLATTTLISGDTVAASVSVTNNGNTTLPAHRSTTGFYLSANATFDPSDVLLGSDTVATDFAAGSTAQATARLAIPAGTTPGSYYVLFIADYGQAFAESTKTNNISTLAVTVENPSIDLLVQTPLVSPATLVPGAALTTTAAVHNQGTVTTKTSTMGYYLSANATLEADDLLLGFYAGSSLAPNTSSAPQTASIQLPEATAAGTYYILFAADHNDNVSETNENNNVEAAAITVAPALANLTFNATTISANNLVTGDLLPVTDSLQNYGTVPAQTSNVAYYLSANASFDAADVLLGTSSGNQLPNRPHGGAYKSATLTIPANTAPGSYYLLFVADPDNLVTESNETDNVASQAISVTGPDVDLIVQHQTLSWAVAAAGNSVSVAASITNQGTTPAGTSSIGYYLSANTTLESSDVLLTKSTGSTLAPGSSAYRNTTLIIPTGTVPGSYYMLFAGDHTDDIPETNETNNVAALAITVSAASAVDLAVQSPSGSPTVLTAGDPVAVASFIYNQGAAPAASSTTGYYLSANSTYDAADVLLGFSPGASLAAGGSVSKSETITVPASTNAGTYYLLFVADHAQAVAESNETNNTSALAISVSAPAYADFSLQTTTVSPASVLAGNSAAVSITIRNQGTAEAASSTLGYYLSADNVWDAADLLLDVTSGTSLAAGASAAKSAILSIPHSMPAGSYYILFAADPENMVAESSETNNISSAALTIIAPTVDLLVHSQAIAPAAVLPGTTIGVSAAIANTGNITATASTMGYYLSENNTLESSDLLLGYSAGSALAAGGSTSKSATLTIPALTTAGDYYILFVADHALAETEGDETNNTSAAALRVTAPAIDFVIQTPAVSVTALVAGKDLSVSATIANSGTAAAAGTIHYYLSADATLESTDIALGDASGGSLAAGGSFPQTATLSIPDNIPTGNYYILFVADAANTVAESNETNNLAAAALAITAPNIDLSVQNATVSAVSVESGQTVSATTTITNRGNVAAPASTVGYYLSTNNTLEGTDILLGNVAGGVLAAGAVAVRVATLTIPANTAAGNYYVLFAADQAGTVTETNETNNVVQVALTVTPPIGPDLVASAPTAPTATMIKGNVYTVSATIRNQGTASSSASNTGFYLSANDTFDNADTFLAAAAGSGLAVSSYNTLTANITIPQSMPPGTYKLFAVADYLNSVAEVNETNNTSSSGVSVVAATIDLAVQSTTVASSSLVAGGATTITANLSNAGNSIAVSSNVTFYLSENNTFETTDVLLTTVTGGSLGAATTVNRTASITIPATTTLGAYFILAVADKDNTVAETNETNNLNPVAITVIPPTVDFLAFDINSPASVVVGVSTKFSVGVSNLGSIASSTSNIGVYLSSDNTLDDSDILIGSGTYAALSPGGYNFMSGFTIEANTAPGSYYLLVKADYNNSIEESNETNNVTTRAITVAAPTVDLVVASPAASPYTQNVGGSITLSCLIANWGNVAAASSNLHYYLSTDNTFQASDMLLGTTPGAALAAGASMNKSIVSTIPVNAAAGNYFVLFVADPANDITENNETNNVGYIAVTVVVPAVDLVIQSPWIERTAIAPYTSVMGSATIANTGSTAASSSNLSCYLSANTTFDASDVLLTLSPGALITSPGGSLAPGASSNRTGWGFALPINTAPGSYYILYVADPTNTETESNETNNVNSIAITVTAPPSDLALVSVYPSVNSLTAGAWMYALVNVSVTGYAPSSTEAKVYLSADQTLDPGDVAVDTIALGSRLGTYETTAHIRIPENTPLGSYHLFVVLDKDNTLQETNETNNVITRPITVIVPGVDFVIRSHTPIPASIPAGNWVNISAAFANNGTSDASYSNFGFYLSTNTTWESTDLNFRDSNRTGFIMQAGFWTSNTASLTIPADTPPGNYYILAVADNTRSEIEIDELNNVMAIPFTVTGSGPVAGTDLAIQAPSSPATTENAGRGIALSSSIVNQGSVAAASSSIGYYLSANTTFETSDIFLDYTAGGELAPGASVNRNLTPTIPVNTPAGNYFVLFVADHNGSVTESNEANNIASIPITITRLADLMVSASSLSTASVAAGSSITVSGQIRNVGSAPAAPGTIGYYLSANGQYDPGDLLLGHSVTGSVAEGSAVDQHATLTIPVNTPAGDYYVLYVADHANAVVEYEEGNNNGGNRTLTVTNTPFPDLVIQSPTVSPAMAAAGDPLTLRATLANTGKAAAPASTLRYYLSGDATLDNADVALASTAVPALAVTETLAQTAEVTLPANTAVGSYHILLVADADSTVTEENELNNIQSIPFPVGVAGKDLVLRSHTAAPDSMVAGSAMAVLTSIFNRGMEAAATSKMGVYLSADENLESTDLLIGSGTGDSLAALTEGERNFGFSIPLSTTAGRYYLIYKVDHVHEVTERDEDNNTLAEVLTITAAPGPDLAIETPALSAATMTRGSDLTATATITNQGTSQTLAGKVQYYLSDNITFESSDVLLGEGEVPALAAGASSALTVNLTIPKTTETGDYFILLVADATGLNSESNEANNMARIAFTVSIPSGINDLAASFAVTIAPNPAPEKVYISAAHIQEGEKIAEVLVYDITGKVVWQAQAPIAHNALSTQVDVRHLSQGTYMLHIRIGNKMVTRRIVVERK